MATTARQNIQEKRHLLVSMVTVSLFPQNHCVRWRVACIIAPYKFLLYRSGLVPHVVLSPIGFPHIIARSIVPWYYRSVFLVTPIIAQMAESCRRGLWVPCGVCLFGVAEEDTSVPAWQSLRQRYRGKNHSILLNLPHQNPVI